MHLVRLSFKPTAAAAVSNFSTAAASEEMDSAVVEVPRGKGGAGDLSCLGGDCLQGHRKEQGSADVPLLGSLLRLKTISCTEKGCRCFVAEASVRTQWLPPARSMAERSRLLIASLKSTSNKA